MRLLIAALISALAMPALQAGSCQALCGTQYHFCLTRSVTKQAKKMCKVDHKTCKKQCRK